MIGNEHEKPLFWIGSSLGDLKDCPDEVQDFIGYALHWAQRGGKSPAAKPLQGFGNAGVLEVVMISTATPTAPCIRYGLPSGLYLARLPEKITQGDSHAEAGN